MVQFVFTCSLSAIDQQLLKGDALLGQAISLFARACVVSHLEAPNRFPFVTCF